MDTTGTLALVGGDEWTDGCTFDASLLAASGGSDVLVLPTAAAYQHPERVVLRAAEWFGPLGGQVEGLMVVDRPSANDPGMAAKAAKARFIYLAGGSPAPPAGRAQEVGGLRRPAPGLSNGAVIAGAGAGRHGPDRPHGRPPGRRADPRPRAGRQPGRGAPLRRRARRRPRPEARADRGHGAGRPARRCPARPHGADSQRRRRRGATRAQASRSSSWAVPRPTASPLSRADTPAVTSASSCARSKSFARTSDASADHSPRHGTCQRCTGRPFSGRPTPGRRRRRSAATRARLVSSPSAP